MFVKGRVKIGFDKQLSSFCVDTQLSSYVEELNNKYQTTYF